MAEGEGFETPVPTDKRQVTDSTKRQSRNTRKNRQSEVHAGYTLGETPIRDAILKMIKENPQLWQKALDRFAKLKPAKKAGRKK